MCINGLDAERPHEGACSKVQASRHDRCPRLIALQHSLHAQQSQSMNLIVSEASRN